MISFEKVMVAKYYIGFGRIPLSASPDGLLGSLLSGPAEQQKASLSPWLNLDFGRT